MSQFRVKLKSEISPEDKKIDYEVAEFCTMKLKAMSELNSKIVKTVEENRILYHYDEFKESASKMMIPYYEEYRKLKLGDDAISNTIKNHLPLLWVTVNPAKDDIELLMTKIAKMVDKSWIDKFYYCFEQRSKDEPYSGFHCHCLIQKKENADRSNKEYAGYLRNTVKHLIGTEKAFNWTGAALDQKAKILNYILGQKDDPEKLDASAATDDWRELNDIPSVFSNDDDWLDDIQDDDVDLPIPPETMSNFSFKSNSETELKTE